MSPRDSTASTTPLISSNNNNNDKHHNHHHHQMRRSLSSRLSSSLFTTPLSQRRKLFLLVFLWTCLCLLLFRTSSSLLTQQQVSTTSDISSSSSSISHDRQQSSNYQSAPEAVIGENKYINSNNNNNNYYANKVRARAAVSVAPMETFAALNAVHNNNNNNNNAAAAAAEATLRHHDDKDKNHYDIVVVGGATNASTGDNNYSQNNDISIFSTSSSSQLASFKPIRNKSDLATQQQQHRWHLANQHINNNNNNNNNNINHNHEAHSSSSHHNHHQNHHHHHNQQQQPQPQPQQIIAGSSCQYDYPSLFDLQFNNIHWQKMTTRAATTTNSDNNNNSYDNNPKLNSTSEQKQATYYLYNAYYDDRWRGGLPSVRVLAMIDRIQPPATNCLLWSNKLTTSDDDNINNNNKAKRHKLKPIVTRASFVYAWYPKWGNYKDGILQPWIVTCPIGRAHLGLVPDSVSLVEVPPEFPSFQAALSTTTTKAASTATMTTTTTTIKNASSRMTANQPQTQVAAALEAATSDNNPPPADPLNNDDNMLDFPSISSDKRRRKRRQTDDQQQQRQASQANNIAMPPSFSSSSSSSPTLAEAAAASQTTPTMEQFHPTQPMPQIEYDCKRIMPISNNLPVFNKRPEIKEKFAVCVKGLDFPHDENGLISVRLVEWIEMLNLLGASKIFLYELDVHENISKVLNYYQQRGIVQLSQLTLPGDQPNLPEYQHLYLKNKLTSKRQNELIPYNDCLYRNLYSYEYLALLDIDEIIMPLGKQQNWYDLMEQVEMNSLREQNYSRASYNVRNVYFFDDLSGPMGTTPTSSSSSLSSSSSSSSLKPFLQAPPVSPDENQKQQQQQQQHNTYSLERGIPHYLHMMSHVYRSKNYTEPGQYVKCFHNTERVVSLHNHFPMNCFGQCTTYSIPVQLAHLQHYRKDCVGPLRQSCKNDFRVFTMRDTTIWKYKQQMIRRTTRVLNHLNLLSSSGRQHQQQ